MLGVNSLVVRNGPTALLGPISFDVSAGSALVIMGETGAGKSLIAQAIMGTIPVPLNVQGEISFDSRRIDQYSKSDRELLWGKHIASLPQEPWRALSPLARSYHQIYESHRFVAGLDSNAAARRTEADFENLNLLGAQTKRPGELSGGMGQRVAIAAALAAKPRLLLADEPTKGLDEDRKEAVINILKSVLHRKDSLVVITHDVSVAKSVGGKILVLKDGELVEQGDTVDVLTRPVHVYTQELIDADPSCWDNTSVTHQGPSILKLRKLVAGRGGKALTKPLDLNISQGRRIAVTGPSGTGKSTLLDTIAEIIKPLSGSLDRSSNLKPTDIQKIYQDPPAAFARSVSLKNSLNDVAKLHEVAWSVVEQYLHLLGISTGLLNRLPTAVSGGELQRIAIARALIVKPKLILADEPTSRLDPITQKQTMNMLADVANVHNTAVLLVTHDRTLAKNWTDETIFLD